MSLALIQGYSSAEEEQEDRLSSGTRSSNEDDVDDELQASRGNPSTTDKNSYYFDLQKPSSNSTLPSAFAAFAEVLGPPEFLNSSVVEGDKGDGEKDGGRRGKGSGRREKRELPPGAVMVSKPQLVGIRDRVRSDIEASSPATTAGSVNGEGKRVISASNPDPKDAADLLRMCLQCGVPKTYSHTRGVVCPICGDRPPSDPLKESDKKKGSTIKDKEKSKRMKGQSSHATWKSETEMQLRQQFD
ncbi:uncharacterized protein LOC110021540 [Phalaenopsis equestris]|uniref:uncharacterized protein LOC110021540 n=1 Tax=Phalaenopsis equestris TaxID=78828 RepID=UPI0009E56503|nr:uncharacterized protein LOC110021540 [Phalaenopsis equestris]